MKCFVLLASALGIAACGSPDEPTAPSAPSAPHVTLSARLAKAPPFSGVIAALGRPLRANGPLSRAAQAPDALAVGSNVRANQDASSNPQNEPSIGIDPNNPLRLFASSNDYRNFSTRCGAYGSTDGGATWHDVGGGIVPAQGTTFSGDPSVAFSPEGTAYLACLGFTDGITADSWKTKIFLVTSSNLSGLQVAGTVIQNSNDIPGAGGFINDKPYITVDTRAGSPHRGRIYVSWTRFRFEGNDYVESPIVISFSDDGGRNWSGPHPVTPPNLNADQGSVPVVDPSGAVYVAFENFNTPTFVNQILVAKSVNGGESFRRPRKAGDVVDICPRISSFGDCSLLNSSFRVNSFPSIAVNGTTGALFVTWGDYRNGTADVLLSRSLDHNSSWSGSVRVNDVARKDQFFPWVDVASDGSVQVAYYDRRYDRFNYLLDVSLSTSTNNGTSFGPATRVTSGSSDPAIQFAGSFIGDYINLKSSTSAHPIWTDTRNVANGAQNQDAFTATVTGGGVAVPLAGIGGPPR